MPAQFSLKSLLWCALFFVLAAARLPAGENWPQWRGPGGQGHAAAKGVPLTWSETENIAWRTPLPGKGWSSPVIEGNQIWMTAAVDVPASPEAVKARLSKNSGNQPLNVAEKVTFYAVGCDRATGRLLGNFELFTKLEPEWVHQLNSYASPSPILEDGKLYCHFGAYGTCCFDTQTHKVLWKSEELQLKHENGPGSTPVLWQNLLIVHCDGSDVQYLAAFEKTTGRVAWKANRSGELHGDPQLRKAYGTPLLLELSGKPVLVSPGADWLYGYDPANGAELWKVSYGVLGFSIVARPVFGQGMLFTSTCFMQAEMLAVKLEGEGPPSIAWRYGKSAPKMPSPLLVGSELYFISDNGVATCLDAATGKLRWTERMPGNFSASPLYVDGKILFSNREGVTTVIAPGQEYRKLAENKLEGQIMASPAALEGAIFIRTDQALYRIELPKAAAATAPTSSR